MRHRLLILSLLAAAGLADAADAAESTYEGTWHTTNRKLDGAMTCVVTELGSGTWQGRFFGVWQGVPFDHVVRFTGSPAAVRGTATIDGANYVWTGELSAASFNGRFSGNRYTGHFELTRKPAKVAAER